MNPELSILQALKPCYPRGLREPTLHAELSVRGTPMSLTDQRRTCQTLEENGDVTIIKTRDFTLIKITAEGLARLVRPAVSCDHQPD